MSIGIILQIMPSLPISQVILHIIGIMPMPIIGIIIGMPIIPIIMGFIIGFIIPPIIGFIIPPIIGFIIPPIMGFIMLPIIGFIIGIIGFIPMFELFIGIGIAFIMMVASYVATPFGQAIGRQSRMIPLLVRRSVCALGTRFRRDGLGAVIADELDCTRPRLRTRSRVMDLGPLVVAEGMFRRVHVQLHLSLVLAE
jgi:hypothetical protein